MGDNTNPPYGYSQIGIQAEMHELGHSLGTWDYYMLPQDMPKPAWMLTDVMYDTYTQGNGFDYLNMQIVNYNYARLLSGGPSAIVYWQERNPLVYGVGTSDQNAECGVYENALLNTVSATPLTTVVSDSGGMLKFSPGQWVYSYKIVCIRNSTQQVFWLPSTTADRCFINNNFAAPAECDTECNATGFCG